MQVFTACRRELHTVTQCAAAAGALSAVNMQPAMSGDSVSSVDHLSGSISDSRDDFATRDSMEGASLPDIATR